MSEFHAVVFKISGVTRHPNADTLSVVCRGEYPIVFKTMEFNEGELAVHVPVDAVLPDGTRIKARDIRGVYSMGMLMKAPADAQEGDDVLDTLGIRKYVAPTAISMDTQRIEGPGYIKQYTDIVGHRAYSNIFSGGDQVVITEKVDGGNTRYCHSDGRLWVGSHENFWEEDPSNAWWKMAIELNLKQTLQEFPDIVFYGELYGWVQKLRYGAQKGQTFFRCFDVFDIKKGRYLDYYTAEAMCLAANFKTVPMLYVGPWNKQLPYIHANGPSLLGYNVREGCVIKPLQERWSEEIGRVIVKCIGKDYQLQKE